MYQPVHYLHFLLCRVVHHLVSPQAFLVQEFKGSPFHFRNHPKIWHNCPPIKNPHSNISPQHHNLCRLPCISALKLQVYLHDKAFPTPCVCTAEGSLPLMVSLYVTVQVEAVGELFVAPFLGAEKLSPLTKVDAQLVLVHEPGVIKQLLTPLARHLGWRDKLAHLKTRFKRLTPTHRLTLMFFSVLQIFCPCLRFKRTCIRLTDVTLSREGLYRLNPITLKEMSSSSDPTCVDPLVMLQFSTSGEFSGAALEGTAGIDEQ